MEKKKLIFFASYSLHKDFIEKYDIKNAKIFFDIKFYDLNKILKKNEANKNFNLENNLHDLKKL